LGIELIPFAVDPWTGVDPLLIERRAGEIVGRADRGDVLVVCDPWGDCDLLCWALRTATRYGMTTISITTDQPNILAVLANHAIRVPVTTPFRREFVITALRHLVHTAGTSLIPARRRATGPLRSLNFGQ
jgi:DNA-binding MurR/RpiR family transcriptional regulator